MKLCKDVSEVEVRNAKKNDIPALVDIDLKCNSLYPWSMEQWEKYEYRVSIAGLNANLCGCAAFQRGPLKFPGSEDLLLPTNSVWIVKLQVKPKFRHHGVGTSLLHHVENYADAERVDFILGILPEDDCYQGELNSWLLRRGYRCRGLVHDCFKDCGQDIDGLLWEKRLSHESNDPSPVSQYVI